MSWFTNLNWDAPAGQALRRLIDALPANRQWSITLFGSAPLQLGIEPTFLSADIDLFADEEEDRDLLQAVVEQAGLKDEGSSKLYVQVCTSYNFRTNPQWFRRAATVQVDHVRVTIPHPIDILIAKLPRLEEKDMRAFRLVTERLGIPTEDQFRRELQQSVDLYRPNFDEEMIGDITSNTAVLWQELWGKSIDVRREIIAPALELRRKGYEADTPRVDYKAELRRLGGEGAN